MMTNADIKELLGKISPDWYQELTTTNELGIRNDGGFICFLPKPVRYPEQNERHEKELDEYLSNAEFIAKAPEIINDLLSQVEKDQRVIERLTETLKTIRKDKLNASFMNMYIDEALKVVE